LLFDSLHRLHQLIDFSHILKELSGVRGFWLAIVFSCFSPNVQRFHYSGYNVTLRIFDLHRQVNVLLLVLAKRLSGSLLILAWPSNELTFARVV